MRDRQSACCGWVMSITSKLPTFPDRPPLIGSLTGLQAVQQGAPATLHHPWHRSTLSSLILCGGVDSGNFPEFGWPS